MKIKKIASLCKQSKSVCLYSVNLTDAEPSYIGTTSGIYKIPEELNVHKNNVLTVLDIARDKRLEWCVKEEKLEFNTHDTDENEIAVARYIFDLSIMEKELVLMGGYGKIFAVRADLLEPLSDMNIEYYVRNPRNPYIVAKSGFFIQAVLIPENYLSEAFARDLQELNEYVQITREER